MNKFKIAETELFSDNIVKSQFEIKSHPKSYTVSFESFKNDFTENDVLLVDATVHKLYNIHHDKMILINVNEDVKCIETVLYVCEMLMGFNFDKGNRLVVIGGGIIQDIGAYTAKTFRRGIDWIYYPTTLLSQCDSCIGGKTALNFKDYKNQLALFSAPSKVIIDVDFLKTLSEEDIISGHGEIVKLFLIGGQFYIDNFDDMSLTDKIYHSLSIKKAVVEHDEFEQLERKSLNYGHSFGHVIEPLTNYTIPHGEAVLLGIELINRIFTKSDVISNIVSKFTDLNKIKNLSIDKLVSGLKTDKKVYSGAIQFVIVTNPGDTVFLKTTIDENLIQSVHEVFVN